MHHTCWSLMMRLTIVLIVFLVLLCDSLVRSAHIIVHKQDIKRLVSDTSDDISNTCSRENGVYQGILPPDLIESGRHVCNVRCFGANGDGVLPDSHAIQSAIESCAARNGVVFFPPGDYLTATIFLRSNIVLRVERGARILGSPNQSDYPAESDRWYVILAENVTNLEITGGGVVDGQGKKFVVQEDPKKNVMVSWNTTGNCFGDECRPRLVGFLDCTNVRVGDVYLHEPAYWCLHFVRCSHVLVENVNIYGDFNSPNNDGIDIEDTNNTRIVGCHIDTGDDAICPKTYTGPSFNLTVTDCWIRTKSSAVKFGSASFFNFHGMRFERLTIVDSHRGLALQLRDGGTITDVIFSNIVMSTRYYHPSWWGRAEPIYITACPRDASTVVGLISNVQFINISSTSQNGIFLSGARGSIVTDVHFQNVSLKFTNTDIEVETFHDYRPGCQGLVAHQSSGVFIEHASDITFKDVNLKWAANVTWRTPLEFTPTTVGRLTLLNLVSSQDL